MSDEDMKIYVPSAGTQKLSLPETDEVRIYTCSSETAEHSAHTP